MAQPFATGVQHCFVGLGGSGSAPSPLYLGTGESFVRRDEHRAWDAIMNDISGSQLPFDYVFSGSEVIHSLVLTRWNMAVIRLLEAQPDPFFNVRGTTREVDVGALMQTEGLVFQFWVTNAFSGKAAYPLLDAGRRYPSTILWGPDTEEGGTRANKRHLIFRSYRIYDPVTRSMLLWDTNLAGLPNPD